MKRKSKQISGRDNLLKLSEEHTGIDLRKKVWCQAIVKVEQRKSLSIIALCSLLGYSRQAYYQQKKQIEKGSLQYGVLIDEVLEIRKTQKRLGCRKLIYKLELFIA